MVNEKEVGKTTCEICDPKGKYMDCICHPSWRSFSDHLKNIQTINPDIIEKEMKISTITACCNFNSKLNLGNISEKYMDKISFSPGAKKSKKHSENYFFNSLVMRITVKYQDVTRNNKAQRNQVCVKYFPNGNLQMTGCNTVMSIAYSIRKCYRRILKCKANLSEMSISNCRIAMINTDFKINKKINQIDMVNSLSVKTSESPAMIIFQTTKYPGINAKFPINKDDPKGKQISCLIFRPGSIILTGGPNIEQYLPIVKYITDILKIE